MQPAILPSVFNTRGAEVYSFPAARLDGIGSKLVLQPQATIVRIVWCSNFFLRQFRRSAHQMYETLVEFARYGSNQ
jgi:hypothetical protein